MGDQTPASGRSGEDDRTMRLGLVLGLSGVSIPAPDIAARPAFMGMQCMKRGIPDMRLPARESRLRPSLADMRLDAPRERPRLGAYGSHCVRRRRGIQQRGPRRVFVEPDLEHGSVGVLVAPQVPIRHTQQMPQHRQQSRYAGREGRPRKKGQQALVVPWILTDDGPGPAQIRLPAQRNPEDKQPLCIFESLDHRRKVVADQAGIFAREDIPVLVERLVGSRSAPWVQDLSVRLLTVMGEEEEGLAEMEDALHPEPELPDAGLVRCFTVLAERPDAPGIRIAELTIVHEEQGRRPQQRVSSAHKPR
ncbi:MAG: hypothetical protein VBE63_20480 [Lamprobacter sp.]|nr:hypothetical protein [Lamprobacter sp.]MEA3642296.1 hypothetical protein [Lamprobacter sp.]